MKRQKRGMTPLIATVLLIGFTVALAAVVMTWGLDFVKGLMGNADETTEELLSCVNQLDFKIEIDCAQDQFTVDNTGSITIESMRFRRHDSTGSVTPKESTGLAPGAKESFNMLSPLTGALKIDVMARIKDREGNSIECTNAVREANVNCGP